MRFFSLFILSSLSGLTFFWSWVSYPEVQKWTSHFVTPLLHPGKYHTLEVRHSAESIMEKNKKLLLKDKNHSYLEPSLTFHPYLLMEVKYNRNEDRTAEGVILWSLTDGEMVINANSWEKTHGFSDCILAGADRDNFKVINALAAEGGSLDRESLLKALRVESDVLDNWLEGCKRKKLIVQNGNKYRLHMQEPHLKVMPETKLQEHLVTKEAKEASPISRKFRPSQIELVAKSAFGNGFTVIRQTRVFLPVHTIIVKNPDGSQMTTYWNALTGKQLHTTYQIE